MMVYLVVIVDRSGDMAIPKICSTNEKAAKTLEFLLEQKSKAPGERDIYFRDFEYAYIVERSVD
jgi:hypothetical protein